MVALTLAERHLRVVLGILRFSNIEVRKSKSGTGTADKK